MLLKVNKQIFLDAIIKAKNLIDTKPIHPVNTCFKIDIPDKDENSLIVTAIGSSGKISVKMNIICCDKKIKPIIVPAENLVRIISLLPRKEQEVTIVSQDDESKITISCGNSKLSLNILQPSDWTMDDVCFVPEEQFSILTPAGEFCRRLNQVSISCGIRGEGCTNAMKGIYVNADAEKKQFTFAATDGRRLSVASFIVTDGTNNKNTINSCFIKDTLEFIFPKIEINTIKNVLTSFENNNNSPVLVGIFWDKKNNCVAFQTETVSLRIKTYEERFPNFKPLIPTTYNSVIAINKDEFTEALQRLSIFTDQTFNAFEISKNDELKMKIKSSLNTVGNGEEFVTYANFSGENLGDDVLMYNCAYFIDGLKNAEGDTLFLNLQDNPTLSPLTISDNDDNLIYILMPICPK